MSNSEQINEAFARLADAVDLDEDQINLIMPDDTIQDGSYKFITNLTACLKKFVTDMEARK